MFCVYVYVWIVEFSWKDNYGDYLESDHDSQEILEWNVDDNDDSDSFAEEWIDDEDDSVSSNDKTTDNNNNKNKTKSEENMNSDSYDRPDLADFEEKEMVLCWECPHCQCLNS